MNKITLGIVKDAFSLDGTLKIISKTQFGNERYKVGNKVLLVDESGNEECFTVESYRNNKSFDFVKFVEISSIEDALAKKNFLVQINKLDANLPNNYYHYFDLEGCLIIDQDGNQLGIVKCVEEFPAQITLRVARKNKNDFFVPFIKDFINEVDISNKKIYINVIEGML